MTTVAVSALLAVLVAAAAISKLSHQPRVVESYRRAGIPETWLNPLAAILLAGAAGLVLGLWWPPIGAAAAAGLTGYFAGAVIAHVRAGDTGRLLTPIGFGALAAATLVLQLSAG